MNEDYVENPPFPSFVQFETNTNCQAECTMCPHKTMQRRGTAKWSLINKIIREAAPQTQEICPFLYQEPWLEPRLFSILANIKQRNPNCQTTIYSNMGYLPEGMWQRVISHGVLDKLHISFYGPTEQLYRKYQPPLNRDATIGNIKRFSTYQKQMKRDKPKVYLQVLGTPDIMLNMAGYKEVAPYVDQIAHVEFDTFHGSIKDMSGGYTPFSQPPAPRTPCARLWTGMNIHFDGSVVPCCVDYADEHVFGNVEKQTLQEVWSSIAFQKFRRLHVERRWGEIPMCRGCTVYKYQFSPEWIKWWKNRDLCESYAVV